MKYINKLYLGIALISLTACDNYLSTVPEDALSVETGWKTEDDAAKFVVGCYDGWEDAGTIMYLDCASDFGYNQFSWEGYNELGNGTISPGEPGVSFYDFTTIRRCNTFLANIDKVSFANESDRKELIAEVKAIRAYRYFILSNWYGGVPIVDNYTTAAEAQVPRNTEQEVHDYVYKDLKEAIADINETPSQRGRIAKGAALAMLMRASLYWGNYQQAEDAAQQIIDLGQYSLEPGIDGFHKLFTLEGATSKEIILAVQSLEHTYSNWIPGTMYNNGEGGWSSIVPTQNCVDNFEMANGKTITDPESGYDPIHPFYNRDPRLAKTIIYPGRNWEGSIYNTLDKTINGKKNNNFPETAQNCSKTALTWAKYTDPKSQYDDMWDTDCSPIVFRYAEVLLTWAECENELHGPSAEVYRKINMVRERAGMPDVDQALYNTKETLRELIRRERGSEFAGEGIRRADLVRWKTTDGKMVAETAMTGDLTRIVGTINYDETDETRRAVIDPTQRNKIETRTFESYNRYLPIPQSAIDANPKLEQNPGYSK